MSTPSEPNVLSIYDSRLVSEGIPDLCPMKNRSPGIHISHLIDRICLREGFYPLRASTTYRDRTRMQMGLNHEYALLERHIKHEKERYSKGYEMEVDEVFMTPDMFEVEESGGQEVIKAVHEIKLTWMTERYKFPECDKFWAYECQLKCYCYGAKVNIGYLHVGFINGNYTYESDDGPNMKCWEYNFTKHQLLENWCEMLVEAEVVERERLEGSNNV